MGKPTAGKEAGLWVVNRRESFVHWCAWREWLFKAAGRTFHPDIVTVWSEWPPRTPEAARIVAAQINAIRTSDRVKREPIDPNPEPWTMYSLPETLELERRHRDDYHWNPPLPAPDRRSAVQKELDEWIDYKAENLPHRGVKERVADWLKRTFGDAAE